MLADKNASVLLLQSVLKHFTTALLFYGWFVNFFCLSHGQNNTAFSDVIYFLSVGSKIGHYYFSKEASI